MTVVVPTPCIAAPRWVQVGVATTGLGLKGGADSDAVPFHVDDGGRVGHGGHLPRLGPRVRRG